MVDSTSILIVGGSLNGLTMAMLLARRRVPCLVLERHPETSIQYKFRGISARSMEIDLFADRWGLLSGREGSGWSDCVRRSSAARALGVVWHGIQPAGDLADVANRFSTACGVGADGAVLIRPDGFIASRHATAADGARALNEALERLWIRTAVNTGGHIR